MAQKRMTIALKLSSCARERKGASTWLEWGKPKETPGATQASKLRQTLETARKNAKNPRGLFRERINFGTQSNAKILTAQLPCCSTAFPYFFFHINAATVLNKQHSAFRIQGAVPSLMEYPGIHWMLLENSPLLFCTFFKDKLTFWSTPVKEWAIPSQLLSSANQRKRIMTASELLHTFDQFSFPILIFFRLFVPQRTVPHSEIDCGKCWGGEIDTKCKRNNERSSTACGSSGLWV